MIPLGPLEVTYLHRDGMTVTGTIAETGERVNLTTVPAERPRYRFRGGRYANMGIMDMTAVLRSGLTAQELTLTFWLITIARPGNVVVVRFRDAKEFREGRLSRAGLSRTMSKLVGKRVLRRESAGTFTINPHFAWIGSAKEHKEAVQGWDEWEAREIRREKGLEPIIEWPEGQVRSA